MATAKKLPSGAYRVRAYIGTDAQGKKILKSFTAPTKKQAEYMASEYLINNKYTTGLGLTFKQALTSYIEKRSDILAPSTYREYLRACKHDFTGIEDIRLDMLTQEDIQAHINTLSATHSAKSVRNAHGLISAVLKEYKPSMRLTTALPQKQRPNLYIPSNDDIKTLIAKLRAEHNQELLCAVLLASYAPMRRSEVCGLYAEDIDGDTIHIHRAIVADKEYKWVEKYTKTIAGDRYVTMPSFVIAELKKLNVSTGRLISLHPSNISDNFSTLLKRCNLPSFRFHDLRHYGASIQHALGIPDAYIMARGGWQSDTTLKNIYRHALDSESIKNNTKINDYFTKLNT